ncbi:MAG: rRNA maturation RNase YbeY [Bacteroidia bacterium]|nr:rRNA maturation RNase YbeY [Bacteroidia bacterium]
MAVFFSYQFPNFRVRNSSAVKCWILKTFKNERKNLKQLNIVFCSDKFLLSINKKFLKHNYFTDIVTFYYHKKHEPVEGEIFISVERVKSNSIKFNTPFKDELNRVIIHGALHLCGYKDKSSKEKSTIRKKEDFYLLIRNF